MKVIVTNITGSSKLEAMLDKDSGVLEFKDGDISHVLHEKQLGKSIHIMKDAPKIQSDSHLSIPAGGTESADMKIKPASEAPSEPVKKPKNKAK